MPLVGMVINTLHRSYIYTMKCEMDWRAALQKYLPDRVIAALCAIDHCTAAHTEEIRLRIGRPLMVYTSEKGYCVSNNGLAGTGAGVVLRGGEMDAVFGAITGKSAYAFADDIKNGFITLEGGIRAGLAGSAAMCSGQVQAFRHIGGINFRIPRQVTGIARGLLPLISQNGMMQNTLIVSAPGLGKTTLVRDISRSLGDGDGIDSAKVTVIDERSELAACDGANPRFDIGRETDVISGAAKHHAVFTALRSLSPHVIVTDEIGKAEDLGALREAANSGVITVATAHAPCLKGLLHRLFFRQVFDEQLFERYVVLSGEMGRITVAQVHDRLGNALLQAPVKLSAPDADAECAKEAV